MSRPKRRVGAICPAKVNLDLRVLGRRRDGYHDIRTVFQAIDLSDSLTVAPAGELSLISDEPGLACDASNLVMRAARLLQEHGGVREGAAMSLSKRIPIAGGLGGGSSDAAGALLALSELWGLSLPFGDLARLGAKLGADVPFFLHGGTAEGGGRGDRISPLPFVGPIRLLLGIPPFGVSAADAYSWADDHLTPAEKDVSVNRSIAGKLPSENDFRWGVNDLERGVFERWPGLLAFRDGLLREEASVALMSGSGSTVFGVFDDSGSLQRAAESLAACYPGWRLLPARAVPDAARVVAAGGPS
jgi:4-diphosphocytidyl-2-C-methyl-D-erythritol kinase